MLDIPIPGRKTLHLCHAVLDYNGTIAVDGAIPQEMKALLKKVNEVLPITVVTADTHGTAQRECESIGISWRTFPRENAALFKEQIVQELGAAQTVCFGNGFNDIKMFEICALGVAVLDTEGMCAALLPHADILCRSMEEALSLLLYPKRIQADLRT